MHFRTIYPSTCGELRGTSAGFTPVDPDRQFVDYFSTDICRFLIIVFVCSLQLLQLYQISTGQFGSKERMKMWSKGLREPDLSSTRPTHLVSLNSIKRLVYLNSIFTKKYSQNLNKNVDALQIQGMKVRILTIGVSMPTYPMEFTTLLAAKGAIQHSSNNGWI